ncbi:hypothetical protein SAMN05216298_4144 [Glycomyces sambucus]|uniref:DUF3137 domain-containing protein n=1 Tax=Glycomyces sambucus TaxID=380244 RepID=A0A1G9KM75_9ACTN|nr:hypothetical protein [Glycomyces sambucus]SDL50762.1 hypothetical protein SAMN05216298_4144 [Glycomyces sambucus]
MGVQVAVYGVFALIAAAAVVGAVLALRADARRRALGDPNAQWAAIYGLHYLRVDHAPLHLSQRGPFGGHFTEQFAHVVRGQYRGAPLLAYTYRYRPVLRTLIGEGDSEEEVSFVAVAVPGSFPVLDVAPSGVRSWLPGERVEFESNAFNDRFAVGSPNPRFAYDVIHPRLMEWLMADARALSTGWRLEGPWLMASGEGPLRVSELFVRADFLHDLIAYMPGHLWPDR